MKLVLAKRLKLVLLLLNIGVREGERYSEAMFLAGFQLAVIDEAHKMRNYHQKAKEQTVTTNELFTIQWEII